VAADLQGSTSVVIAREGRMSDYAAGGSSGAHEGGVGVRDGGSPPPVLLGALGAAALIAVLLLVLFTVGGGGDDSPTPPGGAAAAAPIASTDARVRLTVAFEGDGGGRIVIAPRTDICRQNCAYSFVNGTRVVVTAVPGPNSTFDGWSNACGGRKGCTFVMDRARTLTVRFATKPAGGDAVCDGNADEPAFCADDDGSGGGPIGGSDCVDGKDNDGDGLTDSAEDPGCAADDTEADSDPLDEGETAPPPPPAAVNNCADGKDNDRDGLTDTAQDPDCTNGTSENGASAPPPPPPGATPKTSKPAAPGAKSECRDGIDNDGDGLIDRAQDPGCEADGSEAGE
jgi:hypothetical protein